MQNNIAQSEGVDETCIKIQHTQSIQPMSTMHAQDTANTPTKNQNFVKKKDYSACIHGCLIGIFMLSLVAIGLGQQHASLHESKSETIFYGATSRRIFSTGMKTFVGCNFFRIVVC